MLSMHIKMNADHECDVILKHSVRMPGQLKVDPRVPRVAKKQIHRGNVPANTPERYYKRILVVPIVVPIVDLLISEMTHFLISLILKQLNYWFWDHQFCFLKSLKKMSAFPQLWKSLKKICESRCSGSRTSTLATQVVDSNFQGSARYIGKNNLANAMRKDSLTCLFCWK